jgi:hypothetical protein
MLSLHTDAFMYDRPHVLHTMAQIDHPSDNGSIDVEIIDTESHHGNEMVQVQATSDDITLADESSDDPWVFAERVNE